MCGEKGNSRYNSNRSIGSPPHVRGKETAVVILACIDRITPACAGKSNWSFKYVPLQEDHPRMCGEKFTSFAYSLVILGSPPHVRGKVFQITVS